MASGVNITGTIISDAPIMDSDIVAGGKTVIITMFGGGDTWVAMTDPAKESLIDGFTSTSLEPNGWVNSVIAALTLDLSVIVLTDTVTVTITLPAVPAYNINDDETETIGLNVDADLFVIDEGGWTASQTFEITLDPVGEVPMAVVMNRGHGHPGAKKRLKGHGNYAFFKPGKKKKKKHHIEFEKESPY